MAKTGPKPKTEQTEQAQKERYLRALRLTGTLTAGCRAAKVSPHTVYQWREHDAQFSIEEHESREACADSIEAALVRRAKGRSDLAGMFLLKAMRPAKYRERQSVELSGPDGGPISIDADPRAALAGRVAGLAARLGAAEVPQQPE